ncbi:XRE family transcriptional regulator [Pseudoalteromonas rubra]|uniref:XRE family transcriptional regulator n=2 Tax=Pseudoalteromonas rubra TaxID=43658 RepID=A0A4Q7E4X4_9GAMM|nr:XRE family transcriptional regulator [Pseudoalteromonas rubra]
MIRAGDVLRKGRRVAGLTQLDVAVAYGVSERTYQRWEKGEARVSWDDTAGLVEEVFRIELRELV